jgi:hypothetical protein
MNKLKEWVDKNKHLKPENMKDPARKIVFLRKQKINQEAVDAVLKKQQTSFWNFCLPIANM